MANDISIETEIGIKEEIAKIKEFIRVYGYWSRPVKAAPEPLALVILGARSTHNQIVIYQGISKYGGNALGGVSHLRSLQMGIRDK
ncbi:hypothetical protein EVAR_67449_1 [Eumeta japonica]|uniref:Uncharacterized protein n=1 Tax=Eumeta variegata TaxID=151549 RepID=A0A4C1T1X1_EUMVA|nr:hypothetical protein EVAR_67449_1 [Eumeta japonica]